MNWRFWLLLLAGAMAVLISRWEWNRPDTSPDATPAHAGEPDLFMGNATITQYNDAGAVRYRLVSAEVRHYEVEGLTRLVAPTLTLNRAPQSPWFARAGEGFVRDADTSSGTSGEVDQPDSRWRTEAQNDRHRELVSVLRTALRRPQSRSRSTAICARVAAASKATAETG